MSKLSLLAALCLSVAGTGAIAVPVQPPLMPAPTGQMTIEVACGATAAPLKNGDRSVRRQGNCAPASDRSSRDEGQNYAAQRRNDCHRDIRRHRVDGVMITHRHVGENCEIRVVRVSN